MREYASTVGATPCTGAEKRSFFRKVIVESIICKQVDDCDMIDHCRAAALVVARKKDH